MEASVPRQGEEAHLAAHVDGDADDHGGHGDAGDQRDADGSADQRSQLPQDLLLPAPRLLPPEGAAGRTGQTHTHPHTAIMQTHT